MKPETKGLKMFVWCGVVAWFVCVLCVCESSRADYESYDTHHRSVSREYIPSAGSNGTMKKTVEKSKRSKGSNGSAGHVVQSGGSNGRSVAASSSVTKMRIKSTR